MGDNVQPTDSSLRVQRVFAYPRLVDGKTSSVDVAREFIG